MRQMVGQRKPAVVIAIGDAGKKDGRESQAEETAETAAHEDAEGAEEEADEHRPMDVVTCPKCGCEINTLTGKETTDDGTESDPVESLDESDSTYAKPGPFGSASDAARGADAQSKALGTLGSLRK